MYKLQSGKGVRTSRSEAAIDGRNHGNCGDDGCARPPTKLPFDGYGCAALRPEPSYPLFFICMYAVWMCCLAWLFPMMSRRHRFDSFSFTMVQTSEECPFRRMLRRCVSYGTFKERSPLEVRSKNL